MRTRDAAKADLIAGTGVTAAVLTDSMRARADSVRNLLGLAATCGARNAVGSMRSLGHLPGPKPSAEHALAPTARHHNAAAHNMTNSMPGDAVAKPIRTVPARQSRMQVTQSAQPRLSAPMHPPSRHP